MDWYLTTKEQRKGYKRELSRFNEALTRQDVRGLGSPQPRLRGGFSFGIVGGALICGVAFVVGLLSPKPDAGIAAIVTTREGGMFVQFNGRMHPVTNLASARLIVGKPEDAKVVTDKALRAMPTGPLMGIPSAPNLLTPRDDTKAQWTVCDWRDTAKPLSLLKTGDITTAVIAGSDMLSGGTGLGDDKAVLAKSPTEPDKLWLIYRSTRAEIGRNDYAAQAALGLTPAVIDSAVTVSPALLGSITPSPVLTAPKLAGQGKPSDVVIGSDIGDVLTIATASGGRTFYLVGRDGVQRVSPVLAQMMINTGSAQHLVDDPSTVQSRPRVNLVDDSRFPSSVPTLVSEPALCWSWTKDAGEMVAHTRIFTDGSMPVTADGRTATVHLMPVTGGAPHADDSVTRPGYGWYVRVTGNEADSDSSEQVMWIDANGVRYPIDAVVTGTNSAVSYDPTVKALGFSGIAPLQIPWSVARLYTPGATLSIKNAQVLQGTIDPVTQIPHPADKGGAAVADTTTPEPAPTSDQAGPTAGTSESSDDGGSGAGGSSEPVSPASTSPEATKPGESSDSSDSDSGSDSAASSTRSTPSTGR